MAEVRHQSKAPAKVSREHQTFVTQQRKRRVRILGVPRPGKPGPREGGRSLIAESVVPTTLGGVGGQATWKAETIGLQDG